MRDQVDPGFTGTLRESLKQTNRIYGVGAQLNFGSRNHIGVRLERNIVDAKDATDLEETLLGVVFGWGGTS